MTSKVPVHDGLAGRAVGGGAAVGGRGFQSGAHAEGARPVESSSPDDRDWCGTSLQSRRL
jgi:hypothetical protein